MSESFTKLANTYCIYIDTLGNFTRKALVDLEAVLVNIYGEILKLQTPAESEYEADSIPKAHWDAIYKRLQSLPLTNYWEVFDPLDNADHEPVVGNLADDLADIYKDLKEGLSLWETAKQADATWHWRFTFVSHWNEHLTGSLRALNAFLRRDEVG